MGSGSRVDRRVEEEGGLVEEPFGRADLPEDHRVGERPGAVGAVLRRLVGVEDHRQGAGGPIHVDLTEEPVRRHVLDRRVEDQAIGPLLAEDFQGILGGLTPR